MSVALPIRQCESMQVVCCKEGNEGHFILVEPSKLLSSNMSFCQYEEHFYPVAIVDESKIDGMSSEEQEAVKDSIKEKKNSEEVVCAAMCRR